MGFRVNFSSNIFSWNLSNMRRTPTELPSGLYNEHFAVFALSCIYPSLHPAPVSSPCLERLWFKSCKDKASGSCWDNRVICIVGYSQAEHIGSGAQEIRGASQSLDWLPTSSPFFSCAALLTWWKYLLILKSEFPIISRHDLTSFFLASFHFRLQGSTLSTLGHDSSFCCPSSKTVLTFLIYHHILSISLCPVILEHFYSWPFTWMGLWEERDSCFQIFCPYKRSNSNCIDSYSVPFWWIHPYAKDTLKTVAN